MERESQGYQLFTLGYGDNDWAVAIPFVVYVMQDAQTSHDASVFGKGNCIENLSESTGVCMIVGRKMREFQVLQRVRVGCNVLDDSSIALVMHDEPEMYPFTS